MDKFDQKIIQYLTQDARQSNAEIARKIGLSRTAVSNRLSKLEDAGVITGYSAQLHRPMGGVAAYFHLNYSHGSCEEQIPVIETIPEVRYCHSTTGDIDMIIYAQAEDMAALEAVRNRLQALPRLINITTKTIFKELISR